MTIGVIDPRYGDPSKTPPSWDAIERLLADPTSPGSSRFWSMGVPHAVPLVGVWQAGAFVFCTGSDEQKQRNLDANPQMAVTTGSTGANGWVTGKDVVVEGTAVRVTDARALQALATACFDTYGDDWHFVVRDQDFVEVSDSGAGTEGGARVYRVAPHKVIAFGDGHGQTTYRC